MAQGAGRQSGRGAAGTVARQRALGRSRRQTKHRRIVSLRRSPNARPSAAAALPKMRRMAMSNVAMWQPDVAGEATATTMGRMRNL